MAYTDTLQKTMGRTMKGAIKILIVIFALLLSACVRRPLVDPKDAALLNVKFATDGIHNVTCDIYNPNVEVPAITSEMLRILIYDASGYPILSQGFASTKSVVDGYELFTEPLSLSMGEYKLLSYNFDLDAIRIYDESSYNTIKATTTEVPKYYYDRFGSRADDIGAIYYAPEHFMVARAPKLSVQEHNDVKHINLEARTVVDTYYVQIRITGAQNMAQNAACQAVLTGVSAYNCFGPDIRSEDEQASIYFEMRRNTDPNTPVGKSEDVLCAVFNTFGKIQDANSKLYITLSILTRDGKTHQKVVDMTPIFESEDARQRHWLLIDEVWDIPAPVVSGGGGFAPDVDEWEDIEETIPIGPRPYNEHHIMSNDV